MLSILRFVLLFALAGCAGGGSVGGPGGGGAVVSTSPSTGSVSTPSTGSPATGSPATGTPGTSGGTPAGTPSGTPTTVCDDIHAFWRAEYDAFVAAHSTCTVAAQCDSFWAACTTGLGGCDVPLNVSANQSQIDVIEDDLVAELTAAGCPSWLYSCDCYYDYDTDCVGGQCVLLLTY